LLLSTVYRRAIGNSPTSSPPSYPHAPTAPRRLTANRSPPPPGHPTSRRRPATPRPIATWPRRPPPPPGHPTPRRCLATPPPAAAWPPRPPPPPGRPILRRLRPATPPLAASRHPHTAPPPHHQGPAAREPQTAGRPHTPPALPLDQVLPSPPVQSNRDLRAVQLRPRRLTLSAGKAERECSISSASLLATNSSHATLPLQYHYSSVKVMSLPPADGPSTRPPMSTIFFLTSCQ
ncbi:proline-rich protein 2, partial [Triticum aestivum]|uniref:proline-rich protein 2 n=1 Tax=Triticum aestivum TaxID=4565 RepID=UPI001D03070C